MTECGSRNRILFLLIPLGLWAFLIAFQLFRHALVNRNELRSESALLAWREGGIPTLRGRILDADGIPLAWTEMHCDLILESTPESAGKANRILRRLREYGISKAEKSLRAPKILLRDVSPGRMKDLQNITDDFPEIRLRFRTERKRVEYPEIRQKLGECVSSADGHLTGISGWEKEHDAELAGQPGKFRVMLDRRGLWLSDTLRILKDPEPGKDIRIPSALEHLRGEVRQ